MANWTKATAIRRWAEVIAEELEGDVSAGDILDGKMLSGMTALQLVDLGNRAVLREAMK